MQGEIRFLPEFSIKIFKIIRILIMNSKWLFSLLSILLLAGCMGIDSKSSPKNTFTVNVSFEEVYRRAYEQAERCWRTDTGYPIGGGINQASKTSQLYVTGDLGGRVGQVDAAARSDQSSEVTITVWGVGPWGTEALWAMKEVVQFGVPTCTSYMPRDSYQILK
jgi:hypothetical protein